MSVVYHLKEDYWPVKRKLTERDEVSFGQFVRVSMILARFGSELLSPAEMTVVLFVLGRTLSYSKQGEVISRRNFLTGMEGRKGRVCAGVGMSKNTLDKVLKDLIERDILITHAFRSKKSESESRIYTVNLEKMFVYPLFGSEEELAKVGETPTPEIGGPLPQKLGGQREDILREEPSSIEEGSATEAPTVQQIGRERKVGMGRRIAIDCSEDPRDTVKRIAATAQATRETRVAASAKGVPPNKWKTPEIQALLDKARSEAELDGYKVPRVLVVAKNIGVLHRRMRDSELESPLEFLVWALKNWATIASANRSSKARQARDTQAAQSEMSLAPNFNDLAFRYPYLLAFYNDREQVGINAKRAAKAEEEKVARVAAASQQGIQNRREQARERDLERQKARQALEDQDRQTAQRVRRQPRAVRPVADDDVFPEFKPRVWGE